MKQSKKGQVGGIQAGFYALMFIAIALIVAVIINAFGAEYVDEVQDDEGTRACAARSDGFTNYNSTSKLCYNSTFSTSAVGTASWNITGQGLTTQIALSDGTEDVTDVGIITIVLMLLVALVGLFGWYKSRG